MEKIRVLVGNRPRLMRDLVLAILADQPDIEIVGNVQNDSEIQLAVEETHPDFLIMALDEPEERPLLCDLLLEQCPDMKILALAPKRNSSILVWAFRSIRSSFIEASEEGVLNALRGKTQLLGEGHTWAC